MEQLTPEMEAFEIWKQLRACSETCAQVADFWQPEWQKIIARHIEQGALRAEHYRDLYEEQLAAVNRMLERECVQ